MVMRNERNVGRGGERNQRRAPHKTRKYQGGRGEVTDYERDSVPLWGVWRTNHRG